MSGGVEGVVWVLALVGTVGLLLQLWGFGRDLKHRSVPSGFSVLLLERNQGCWMEWFIRSVMHLFSELPYWAESELVIVDCGSDDETKAVLRRFSREFPALVTLSADIPRRDGFELGYFLCQQPIVIVMEVCERELAREKLARLLEFVNTTVSMASAGRNGRLRGRS